MKPKNSISLPGLYDYSGKIKCSSRYMHESFTAVRQCYRSLLYVIHKACIIDVDLAQKMFCLGKYDAFLLKQSNIGFEILNETLMKNDHLFNFSLPKKPINLVINQKVYDYYFLDKRFIPLMKEYMSNQRSICLHLKEIVKLNPVVAQQLFDASSDDIEEIDKLSIIDVVSISEKHHWLIKLNQGSKIFCRSAELRSHSRGIVDTVLNSSKY